MMEMILVILGAMAFLALVVFCASLPVRGLSMKKRVIGTLVIIGLVALAYVGTYLLLAVGGRYDLTMSEGMGTPTDYFHWTPSGFGYGNWLECFYRPLYSLDCQFWHDKKNETHRGPPEDTSGKSFGNF